LGATMERSANYSTLLDKSTAEGPNSNVSKPLEAQHVATEQLLAFPDTFSSSLCDTIRGVLFDIKEEAEMIRKYVVKENIARRKDDQLQNDFDVHPENLDA